jgi:hypothetical protein
MWYLCSRSHSRCIPCLPDHRCIPCLADYRCTYIYRTDIDLLVGDVEYLAVDDTAGVIVAAAAVCTAVVLAVVDIGALVVVLDILDIGNLALVHGYSHSLLAYLKISEVQSG